MNEPHLQLMHMAATGDLSGAQQALGVPPQACDVFGRTALHEAAAAGHSQIMRALLEAGADPNAACHDGWTPLCEAAKFSRPKAVLVLLDHGARLDLPRPLAAYNAALRAEADTETFQALLTGMPADALDKNGRPIIETLIRKNRTDLISLFLHSGASAQITPNGDCPIITLALLHSSSQTVRMLLDEVAGKLPPQALDEALSLACKRVCERPGTPTFGIVQHLLSLGANPSSQNSSGLTPLQHACLNGQYELMELFIGEGDMPKEAYKWVVEGALNPASRYK
jgi:ankyrin repeat protein